MGTKNPAWLLGVMLVAVVTATSITIPAAVAGEPVLMFDGDGGSDSGGSGGDGGGDSGGAS
ncbi:MAG: hypothetical protein Q7S34_02765 [bacterium]|nr:hypothetical protein [bacterium]